MTGTPRCKNCGKRLWPSEDEICERCASVVDGPDVVRAPGVDREPVASDHVSIGRGAEHEVVVSRNFWGWRARCSCGWTNPSGVKSFRTRPDEEGRFHTATALEADGGRDEEAQPDLVGQLDALRRPRAGGLTGEEHDWLAELPISDSEKATVELALATTYRPMTALELGHFAERVTNWDATHAQEDRALLARAHCPPSTDELSRVTSASIHLASESASPLARTADRPRWEANPSGFSGRLVRGYRHWRHKR